MFRPVAPVDLNQRYIELNAIRQMRTLTREESKEFETLYNSREAAAHDPEVLAARAENDRLLRQFQAQQHDRAVEENFRRLFNTVITFPDGSKKQAVDNSANRNFIREWADGEQFQNVVQWFTELVKSPIAREQLSWALYLTPAQKKEQAEKDERALQAHFRQVCRDHGISENTANFSAWSSILDPVITELGGQKVVLDAEGNAIPLVLATPEEQQTWEKERFDQHQADLRRMQKANDIQGLRAAAHQERAQQYQNSATLRRDRELASQYAKDTLAGFTEPLPRVFDKKTIYGWDTKTMREKISRYGASRITARIYGLTEIEDPDKPGEIIKFE